MISSEQNSERQIQRLGAQRQLYATAKRVFGFQVFLSGPVAIATAVVGIFHSQFKDYVVLWGITVVCLDVFGFTPSIKYLRTTAARVQEMFDCDVLSLPWNSLKAGKRPDAELVKEKWDEYQKSSSKMPPLTNWYAPAVGELPLYVGRIACQRSNCWWDAKQRRKYALCVVILVSVSFAAVWYLALAKGLTVENFLVKVLAPLVPALVVGVRQVVEQLEAAERLDKLKEHSNTLWQDALAGGAEAEISASSRNLQDEIFENRRKGPLVFDAIFKWLRDGYEDQMNHGVAELVAEAKAKLSTGPNLGVKPEGLL